MAMDVGRGEDDPMLVVNLTPLIDVMLVLLTLLIIMLPLRSNMVKVDMRGGHGDLIAPIVNLGADFDGTMQWNGAWIDRATLNCYFREASQADPRPETHLNPNKLAKYDIIAKVLADAQRNGVNKLGFTGLDQYMQ